MKRAAVALVVVVAGCVACSDTTPPPQPVVRTLSFKNDSAQQYGCAVTGCTCQSLYCREWVPSSLTYTGYLTEDPTAALKLTIGPLLLTAPNQAWQRDSLVVALRDAQYCDVVGLRLVRTTAGKIGGTFQRQHDCHSLLSTGTVTGQ